MMVGDLLCVDDVSTRLELLGSLLAEDDGVVDVVDNLADQLVVGVAKLLKGDPAERVCRYGFNRLFGAIHFAVPTALHILSAGHFGDEQSNKLR